MEIKIIETEEQYRKCLARMNAIFHAVEGTPEGDELKHLADIIENYKDKHYPLE